MKKQILTLGLSTFLFTTTPAFSMDTPEENGDKIPTHLRWQDRDPTIKSKINEAYSRTTKKTREDWRFYGEKKYEIGGMDEVNFFHHLITANPGQKEWIFLDIGAGDYQWGDHLSEAINGFTDIFNDVKVIIIGLGGEAFQGEKFSSKGKWDIYRLDEFKIEKIEEALKNEKALERKALDLASRVDGIFTRWSFLHFVDPIGTLEQAHNLLKPSTGLFFGDGFPYILKGQHAETYGWPEWRENMQRLLWNMKVPFVIDPNADICYFHFIFKRNDEAPLKLPLRYAGLSTIEGYQDRALYERIPPVSEWMEPDLSRIKQGNEEPGVLYSNSKAFFDYLTEGCMFHKTYKSLGPQK